VKIAFSPRATLILFIVLALFMLTMAVWWFIFLSNVVDEKIRLAGELKASPELVESIRQEEWDRHLMLWSEGLAFILILLGGLWLIYRTYVKARQMNELQENFILSVTHELKTPVASLMVFLDGLESNQIPAHRKEEIVPKMRYDLLRLRETVEKVLEAGRLDRTSGLTLTGRLDLCRLIEERLERLESMPTRVPVKVVRDLECPAWLNGDKVAIGRAIDAILENGLKYNKGDRIEIAVRLSLTSRQIEVSISDNGIGIDKSNLNRIFDRFFRVGEEMTRQFDGSGLGLFICRKTVQAHRGTIEAHSDGIGKGATLVLRFRRA